jgi:hypothetical protein
MSWKHEAVDGRVELIVEPTFHGDLVELAKLHDVWIVDTPGNKDAIDASWRVGRSLGLYEINRCAVAHADAREDNLLLIMSVMDDHYSGYDLVVHGLESSESVGQAMREQGFQITELTSDGFVAIRVPGVREGLLGRLRPARDEGREP